LKNKRRGAPYAFYKLPAEDYEALRNDVHNTLMIAPTLWHDLNREAMITYKNYRYAVEPVDPNPPPQPEPEDTSWRDHLQDILTAIRTQLGIEEVGHLSLVGPRQELPYGTPEYGYDVIGHFRCDKPINKEEYGEPPYEFTATISPEDELTLPVKITGQ
jgi:hypothetical protein